MSQEQIQVPKGWTVKKVSEITKPYSGGTPSRSNPEYWENGTIPWLRSGDLKNNLITKAVEFITDKGLKESSAKLWPKNSVVIALTGANTGKTGILDFECCGNQSIVGILPNEIILSKYLWYYMQFSNAYFWSKAIGGAQPHINGGIVSEREIIFPENKETQKKIVQKLDDVLGQLEEKRTQILQTIKPENIPLLTERMKQEILKSAFSGKLTKREPNDEPVEKLLERIKSNRKESNKTENHLLEEINSSDTKLPQHWKYVKIHEVCDGVVPGRYKPQKFDGNIPWITLPDITSLYVSKSKQNRNLSEEETKKVNMKIFPPKTVLMSCVGEVGRICITKCKVVPNQQLHGFISYDKIMPEYIAYALMSIIDQIRKKATKTTMPYLNKTKCNNLIICLTSIEEEERIVNKINEKFGAIDLIHNRLKKVTESYDKLNNSLNLGKSLVLDAAFSGKLVK